MNTNELKNILELHKKWLNNKESGVRANLSVTDLRGVDLCEATLCEVNFYGANLCRTDLHEADLCRADLHEADLHEANLYKACLRGTDFHEANLCGADLYGVDLCGADLYKANLCGANLWGADLRGANLCGANLQGAILHRANLYGATLYGANLRRANLRETNLRETNLREANLRGADLHGAKNIPFIPYTCPDTGSFIGYKKANGYIVVLEILSDARRCSATGRKCRCDKAKVLEIQNRDGSKADMNSVASGYNSSFVYTVGEIVKEPNFDEDRWNECSAGIHFFINRQEAVEY